ncbi:LacI family transcriptional regulator [Niveispirillum lacus]|uniref:LacI family transcriptional regulator n=2 Tax=Niveispirillum lacus TaxID=1981099 RepID=A0A255YRI4_9PROT|nr:LacI family transcriptional regulator [Niveispirillum lacus]
MADLADLAQVSKITVSRALRDSPTVKPDTRAKIQALAKEHGYKLNLSARSLRLQRSNMVAVVVEMKPNPDRPLSDPFPMALIGGICQELTSVGYAVLLTTRDGVHTPAVQTADGLILLGQGRQDEAAALLADSNVPLVVWGTEVPGHDYVTVGPDNRQGGALAAQHFLTMGRRRGLFIGDTRHADIAQRHEGFRNTLVAGGGQLVGGISCPFSLADGSAAIAQWVDGGGGAFDCLLAASDLLAIGALQALRKRHIAVPDMVSVIGYDDTPLGASLTPALSSVRQDWQAGGTLLARRILSLINGEEAASASLAAQLMVRGT